MTACKCALAQPKHMSTKAGLHGSSFLQHAGACGPAYTMNLSELYTLQNTGIYKSALISALPALRG